MGLHSRLGALGPLTPSKSPAPKRFVFVSCSRADAGPPGVASLLGGDQLPGSSSPLLGSRPRISPYNGAVMRDSRRRSGAFVLGEGPAGRLSLLGTRPRLAALGPAAPPQEWVACEMAPGEARGRGRNPSVRSGVLGAETEQPSAASCRAWALGQSPGPSVLCRVRGPVYLPFPSSEIKHLSFHSARGLGRARTLETLPGVPLGVGKRAAGGGRSPGRRLCYGPTGLHYGHIWAQQHLSSGPGQHLGQCPIPHGQTVGGRTFLFH